MKVVATVRLRIRDQSELLNQIAGTYKDFFRAAMEYVDNAIDAAAALRDQGMSRPLRLSVDVDVSAKSVSFTDTCGGMNPNELCELLSEVGRSKKKAAPWANGQFGFGVHAFRAFARRATFISRTAKANEARITIDRDSDENIDVPCELTGSHELAHPGTRVTISRFDPHIFKRANFMRSLVAEIEHHFDDVLRSSLIKIEVSEGGAKPYECRFLDFAELPGSALTRLVRVAGGTFEGDFAAELKVLDRVQEDRLPVLTNKGRRVQTIAANAATCCPDSPTSRETGSLSAMISLNLGWLRLPAEQNFGPTRGPTSARSSKTRSWSSSMARTQSSTSRPPPP